MFKLYCSHSVLWLIAFPLKNSVYTLVENILFSKMITIICAFSKLSYFADEVFCCDIYGCWVVRMVVAEGWGDCGNFVKQDNKELCHINWFFSFMNNFFVAFNAVWYHKMSLKISVNPLKSHLVLSTKFM